MKTFFSLLLGLAALPAAAQTAGTVTDAQGQPVSFANVALLSLPDSAVVSATVTADDGTFRLDAEPAGRLLRVQALGYKDAFCRPDTLRSPLRLEPDGQLLGEASVTARRPVSRMEGDALVTSVEGTVLSQAGTAEDVLAHVPGITKDQDGFTVQGKGAPIFYINGRLVRDNSELERLSSEEVKSVEVVRSPGARYDATVSAVVRIRTVRRVGDGLGGSLMAYYSQGRVANGTGQLDLNWRHGALDLFASGRYSDRRNRFDSYIDNTTFVDRVWSQHSKQLMLSHWRSFNATLGFNYELSEGQSLGLRYSVDGQPTFHAAGTFEADATLDGDFYDHLVSYATIDTDEDPEHSVNAYYNARIGGGELSIDADFYASGTTDSQTTDEQSAEHDNRVVNSVNYVRNRLVAARADYSHPLWQGMASIGAQATATNRHDDYVVPEDAYGLATSRTQLKELNVAGYVQWARPFKWGQLTAGLRFEHVTFDYYADGVQQPEQSRTFDNLFPSLTYATQLGHTQLMASYTARTSRPDYDQLSNNRVYANRFLMQGGNPYLDPTTTHDVTLTGVWKFLQGVVSFKQNKGAILNWTRTLSAAEGTTLLTYVNRSYPSLNVVATAAPEIGWWQPTWTLVFDQQWLTLQAPSGQLRFDNPIFVGVWNNAIQFPHSYLLNVDFTYLSSGHQQNATLTSRGTCFLNVSLRKSWLNDALSLTLGAQDLFRKMGTIRVGLQTGVSQLTQWNNGDTRQFHVTLRYRFNPAQSKYKGKSAMGDELDRL